MERCKKCGGKVKYDHLKYAIRCKKCDYFVDLKENRVFYRFIRIYEAISTAIIVLIANFFNRRSESIDFCSFIVYLLICFIFLVIIHDLLVFLFLKKIK